ncbi:MAG: hypothetical protein HOH14_02150 [Gammaproteobacteria bacterium]|jgi:membrane-anchored protein YejM (alkaline phosphatase superfamily)|nr:hypothetical protein [Gammaproteobacteria bacterium]MBT6042277.1 hypothetical protein [Gammaproteobacteria bacterium]
MRKALLLSPWTAAILFTIPQSWELMHRPDSDYIPLVFEVLLLLFAYLAAAIANTLVIVPLCLLVKMKTSNLLAGLMLAFVVAFIGTTVAYAFEIFNYRSSILHPDYLYPLLIPLFVMTCCSFFLLTRSQNAPETEVADDTNEDTRIK